MSVNLNRRIVLAAIFACVAMYGLTLGLIRPLISLILENRGYARSVIGMVASVPAFGILASSFVIPPLIVRFGIRTFMIGVLVLDVSVIMAFPIFDNLSAWFAISLMGGVSTNCLLVASETWVNEITEDANRGRVLGIYGTVMAASLALGPLVIPITGIVGWLPFLIGAGLVLLAAVPLFWATDSSPSMSGASSFNLFSFVMVAPALMAGVLLFSFKDTVAANLLPVFAVRSGLSQSISAIMLTAMGLGAVCLTFPIGILADRFNRYWLMVLCALGVAVGAAALPFVVAAGPLLWAVLFLWGGMFSGLYTLVLTIIGQRFRGVELAVANVSIGAMFGFGALIGPSVTGVAMDVWDPNGFSIVIASFAVIFVIGASLRKILARDTRTAM